MKCWKTEAGKNIEYKNLKDDHLLNILKWIDRRAENGMTLRSGGGTGWDGDDIWYDEFLIEGDEVFERYDYKGLINEAKKRKLNFGFSQF